MYAIFDTTSSLPSRLVEIGMIDVLGDAIGYITGRVSSAELKNTIYFDEINFRFIFNKSLSHSSNSKFDFDLSSNE